MNMAAMWNVFVCSLTQVNAVFSQVHIILPQFQMYSFVIKFLGVMKLAASAV
jgi:hypothetical protein